MDHLAQAVHTFRCALVRPEIQRLTTCSEYRSSVVRTFAIGLSSAWPVTALPHDLAVDRDAPQGGTRRRCLLGPAQLFLDHPGIDCGLLVGYKLLKSCDLLGRQVDVIQILQDRTPKGFEAAFLNALFLSDLVQRIGEDLHDVEPVHRHVGVGKAIRPPAQ